MWRVVLICVALAGALPGCAAPPVQSLGTASGRPEIVIHATKKQVVDVIVARALSRGSQVRSVSDYAVVLARRADGNFAASLLYGSRYDSTPEARIHLNLVDVPEGVRVFARGEMVTNPGTGFERVSDMTAAAAGQLQSSLREIAAQFPAADSAEVQVRDDCRWVGAGEYRCGK